MPLPSKRTVEILRRAADGGIRIADRRRPVYGDGAAVRDQYGNPLPVSSFCLFVRRGWLLPGEDVGMWRARDLAEGKAPAMAKGEDELAGQSPTPQQVAILRRIAQTRLVVSFVGGRKTYAYADGPEVRRQDAERLIRQRWVVPESPGLFHGEEPQTYIALKP